MQRIILIPLGLAFTNQVIAHPSLTPHSHPHGISALAGLDSLLAVALIVAGGWVVWKLTRWR
ncbi:MAG: hypothetical protein AB7O50_01745 [Pseudolabrys sp.]